MKVLLPFVAVKFAAENGHGMLTLPPEPPVQATAIGFAKLRQFFAGVSLSYQGCVTLATCRKPPRLPLASWSAAI